MKMKNQNQFNNILALRSETVTRTTNADEFHSYFKNNFSMSHPNIYNFLNMFLEVQVVMNIKIKSVVH